MTNPLADIATSTGTASAVAEPGVRLCQHCRTTIEFQGDDGWVDTVSGDDYGTFDYCPEAPIKDEAFDLDRPHQPTKRGKTQ